MDRITESLLKEFVDNHDLSSLREDEAFEHFASYITVRRHHSDTFHPSDIATGSGNDLGLDAVAIIVNGTLVTDIDTLADLVDVSGYLDVLFIFVQADRSTSFSASKIDNIGNGVAEFFSSDPEMPRNDSIKESASMMSMIYDNASKFKRTNPAVKVYYVTTGKWTNDAVLEARRRRNVKLLADTDQFGKVDFECLGAAEVHKLYQDSKNAISRTFSFENKTELPEIEGVSEAFVGHIPALDYIELISDEEGDINQGIFYDNVRDWHKYNAVNSEIRDTIQSPQKQRFVIMNNGVTIIARSLHKIKRNQFTIEDFQIVNGCQTSHVLFDQKNHLGSDVSVPIRLIVSQDEELIELVIRATNRQTEIKSDEFFALNDFPKELEKYFRAHSDEKKLYYERRPRQYDRQPIKKGRIVTQKNMVRAYAAMFLGEPHRTTRNYSALSSRLGKDICAQGHRYEPYYTACFALYRLEACWKSVVSSKLKPARFHIMLAARLLVNPSDPPRANSHDIERFCKPIIDVLWSDEKAEKLVKRAAGLVDEAVKKIAGGVYDRDKIRSQPFTEEVIRLAKAARRSR